MAQQIFPPIVTEPRTLTRQVWGTETARRIPGVGRALDLLGGLASQMPLDAWAGITPVQPRPPLLDCPDLDKGRALFVRLSLEDYLLQGNAAALVTVRNASTGRPAALRWFPAADWYAMEDQGRRRYWLRGKEVDRDDVVHVQNGADPLNPARGVGVVERYVSTLDKVALQAERERSDTQDGFVPSVAVIAPQDDDSTEEEQDEQASAWEKKFQGPGRRPAILPHGTEVKTLAWSPNDAQLAAARNLSLVDTANMFNLDAYWLGAPASSHTYRTPGSMFLVLLRTSLNGLLVPFEDVWSRSWTPRGQTVQFGRDQVLGEDLQTMVAALTTATRRPIMTVNEARGRMNLAPIEGGDELPAETVEPVPLPADPDNPDNPQDPNPGTGPAKEG